MHVRVGVIAAGAVLFTSSACWAEPSPKERDEPPGVWVVGALSFLRGSGVYHYNPSDDDRSAMSSYSALAGVGYGPWRLAAFGIGAEIGILDETVARFSHTTVGPGGSLVSVSALAELRPLPDLGAFVLLGLGWGWASFGGSQDTAGGDGGQPGSLRGPVESIAAGWTVGPVGPFLRFTAAQYSAELTTYRPLFVGAGVLVQAL